MTAFTIFAIKEFMSNAKEAFKNQIPRDKVDDIAVTDCAEKDGAYEVTGSVGATSPTGKLKTFGYTATVTADANARCWRRYSSAGSLPRSASKRVSSSAKSTRSALEYT